MDISLNNLIPHTRGDPQKNSLPLNQLISPTSPTGSGFSSPSGMNNNQQSMFSNSCINNKYIQGNSILLFFLFLAFPMNRSGNPTKLK